MTKAIGITGVPRIAVEPTLLAVTLPIGQLQPADGFIPLDPDKTYAVFVSSAGETYIQLQASKENLQTSKEGMEVLTSMSDMNALYPGGFIGHVSGCYSLQVAMYPADIVASDEEIQRWGHLVQVRCVEMPPTSTNDTGLGVYTPLM